MDEARVLARLDRIEELDRSGAAPDEVRAQLLVELRELLLEAAALKRDQPETKSGEEVVGRPRTALARDIIGM
jgi:hypothetical protein